MNLTSIHLRRILIALLLFGMLGVVTTYSRLSQTDDEGFHINCGMEWWKEGTYKLQALHPPLARAADAMFPYFATLISDKPFDPLTRQAYLNKLTLARMGTLPFYLLSCALVYLWSRNLFGPIPALWSLALYVTLSTVTAHAGLATTDMAYTALLLWALMRSITWLSQPSPRNSALAGLSVGLMISAKFSAFAHWPAAMALILVSQMIANRRRSLPTLALKREHFTGIALYIVPMVVLSLALIYRFDFDPFVKGVKDAHRLSNRGFSVWLYGPLNHQGVWYFFPVVFFFKTNLTLFIATIIGHMRIIARMRTDGRLERMFPLMAAIGIMLVSMNSNINLGVRHVLPLYPLLAIPAGYGLAWLWEKAGWKRAAAGGILGWQLISFLHAYPEHIAYFNVLAGPRPETISLDSDYDWGQDMIILDEALQERGIDTVYLCARKDVYWNIRILSRARILQCPGAPVTGWIAVGRAFRLLMPNNFAWLNNYQGVQISNSTLDLYYIPPNNR